MICAGEFDMADEAFALSPISARAAQPSEEDYDAISEAFMETSRGRWFLGEYAKRNRNADTRMVLDAVARIEESLAAQRQPAVAKGLAEALSAIRGAVVEARTAAGAAIDGLALEQTLAPVRKGARVIREIAWRLREIGADGRICDLIDSQVTAIETGCGQVSSNGALAALGAAFDLVEMRIAAFADSDMAAAPGAEKTTPSPAPQPDEVSAAVLEGASTASATDNAQSTTMPVEAVAATADEAAGGAAETVEMTPEAAAAHDEAVLDLVALEMAAPDASEVAESFEIDPGEIHAAAAQDTPETVTPEIAAQPPEPAVEAASPPAIQLAVSHPQESSPGPAPQPSLGSSLIASGIVRRPLTSRSDPLAPIRRMSQAEKIALFS
jgi:hypothetical protein